MEWDRLSNFFKNLWKLATRCNIQQLSEETMQTRILTHFFEAVNQRNPTLLRTLYATDALIHSREGPVRGPQAIEKIAERWWCAFPDLHITPLHVAQEEDVTVVHWRAAGVHKEAMLDIPATGKKTAFHGLTCFRIKNQKVIEHWACTDYRTLLS